MPCASFSQTGDMNEPVLVDDADPASLLLCVRHGGRADAVQTRVTAHAGRRSAGGAAWRVAAELGVGDRSRDLSGAVGSLVVDLDVHADLARLSFCRALVRPRADFR